MALCTQAEVEKKLQWDITAEPDSVVTQHIADAQALMEAEVGRTLESDTRTETFDGGPEIVKFLRWWPVTSITSVTDDGTALVEDTDFKWEPNGKLYRIFPNGYLRGWKTTKPQSIDVVYTGGFLAGEQPDHDQVLEHLGSLCAEIVARAFRRGADSAAIPAGSAGGVQSVTLEGAGSVTYQTGGGEEFTLDGGLGQFIFLTDDETRQLGLYKSLLVV